MSISSFSLTDGKLTCNGNSCVLQVNMTKDNGTSVGFGPSDILPNLFNEDCGPFPVVEPVTPPDCRGLSGKECAGRYQDYYLNYVTNRNIKSAQFDLDKVHYIARNIGKVCPLPNL